MEQKTLAALPIMAIDVDTSDIFIFIIIAILFLAIILCIIYMVIISKSVNKSKVDNNIRIYRYDYSRKIFTYFDKMNLESQKTFSEKEFLDQFKATDRYRVQDWLKDISQQKNTDRYIQADVNIQSKNNYVTSMLELTAHDADACIIHFESHLLPFATFKPKIEGIFTRKRHYILQTKEAADEFISAEEDGNSLGAVYFFKVYHLDGEATADDDETVKEINEDIFDLLLHYCNKKRKLYKYSPTEEVMIATFSYSKMATMEMAYTLATNIQQHLNFKVANSNLGVAVGISLSYYYGKNLDKAIEQASSMADAITDGLVNSSTALFDPQFFARQKQQIEYINEVKVVLKNHTYRLFFTPTFNINSRSQDFYLLSVKPFGTKLEDFSSLIKISENITNGPKIILTEVIDRVRRIAKNRSIKLLVKIPLSQARNLANVIALSGDHSIKWIICFDESDLITQLDELQAMRDTINLLLNKGHEVALNISSTNPLLPSKINILFSYFLIGKKFTTSVDGSVDTNSLKLIESEYKSFPGKIVYNYLRDADDVAICAHYSGVIFQCDSVGEPSSIPEVIEPHQIDECLRSQNL